MQEYFSLASYIFYSYVYIRNVWDFEKLFIFKIQEKHFRVISAVVIERKKFKIWKYQRKLHIGNKDGLFLCFTHNLFKFSQINYFESRNIIKLDRSRSVQEKKINTIQFHTLKEFERRTLFGEEITNKN